MVTPAPVAERMVTSWWTVTRLIAGYRPSSSSTSHPSTAFAEASASMTLCSTERDRTNWHIGR
jgi:hypothetical protein